MPDDKHTETAGASPSLSRRKFLKVSGVAATAGVIPATGLLLAESEEAQAQKARPKVLGPAPVPLTFNVNGQKRTLQLEPRVTLLDALRNRLDLTGAKKVCDRGHCGACTVIVNGKTVMSCMTLAVTCAGAQIQTVEGLAKGDELHPVQEKFIEHDGLMCGYCTPGFIMSVKALLEHNPNPTLAEVKAGCQGNVCRCGTYPRIFEAALAAAQEMRKG